MKTQTKSAIVLVVTLIVGIAIGVFAWSIVHNERMERLRKMRGSGGIYTMIELYTSPVDSEQEVVLREFSERYQARFDEIYGRVSQQRREIQDSMRVELRTILTPEQQEEMAAWLDKSSRSSN